MQASSPEAVLAFGLGSAEAEPMEGLKIPMKDVGTGLKGPVPIARSRACLVVGAVGTSSHLVKALFFFFLNKAPEGPEQLGVLPLVLDSPKSRPGPYRSENCTSTVTAALPEICSGQRKKRYL